VINKTALEMDGYSFTKGFCCYKIITRISLSKDEQQFEAKLKDGDNLIRVSSCIEIDINSEETELKAEFIMVECGLGLIFPKYRAWHGIGLVVPKSKVEAKINYWKFNKKHEKSPPNVIIIVLDSTSRLNFQRQMPNTVKMLQNLKAVEMLGFTKGL
jgi:hypothetical protein